MSENKKPRIFLSYARGDDGAFVRRLYDDLTACGFDVWFDRVSMPSRNLTFHQEIRDAVAAHDRLLLVIGPKAVTSEYVRQEWQFAWFEAEKIVTPILRLGDYPLAIDELKLVHAEDFRNDADYALHLKELVRILNEPPPRMGKLIAVPSLPAHYLSRTDRLIPLRDAVRSGLDSPAPFGGMTARQQFHGIAGAAKQVGIHGMGGIGKSVLANLLAHDRQIREAFPDGIVWVGLGSVPVVADLMRRVHVDFGGDGAFVAEHEGKVKLKELLSDKAVLLVLDDAWRRQDIEAFDILGPRCRALITTRDAGLLTSVVGTQHLVELLTDDEALRLLALAVGKELDELPTEARMVIKQCGRLPLAVSLAGGMVAAGMSWTTLLTAFDRHKLEFFKDEHRPEQHQSLWKMIEMSVRALDAAEQMRLVELGVFSEDEAVPEKAVATLWQHTGQLDDLDTPELLVKLKQRSLVQLSAREQGGGDIDRVSLHDLVHDYCLRRAQIEFGKPAFLDDLLLAAYQQQSPGGWWTGPNDGYFHSHLRDHLVAAGRGNELADLLHELPWLEAKNAAGLVFDLMRDFKAATDALPKTDERHHILRLLDEALRQEINFIARHALDYPQALFQCLWNSCWWYDCAEAPVHYVPANRRESGPLPWEVIGRPLSTLLEQWRGNKMRSEPGFAWLRSLRPPVVRVGTAQQACFRGHTYAVHSVVFSADGRTVASGSGDGTLRIWECETGRQVILPIENKDAILSVAYSPDGKRIATALLSDTIHIWDAHTGQRLVSLKGHEVWEDAAENGLEAEGVESIAFSPDGTLLASGGSDKTIRLWDPNTGLELKCFRGCDDRVRGVMFAPSGNRIVSSSRDNTVRTWDVDTGQEIHCLRGHELQVYCVAYSPDGSRVASGSNDRTIRIWDADAGAELVVISHGSPVKSLCFAQNGAVLISGAEDRTIRLWNTKTGAEIAVLKGHDHAVTSITLSPNGSLLASASWDCTVRLWDLQHRASVPELRGQGGRIGTVLFSPDGQSIVSGTDDYTLRLWDSSGLEQATMSVPALNIAPARPSWSAVSFSPDSKRVVGHCQYYRSAHVWNAEDGCELFTLLGHDGEWSSNITFTSDGRLVAGGSLDGTARIWSAESGSEVLVLRGHKGWVTSVAFSPDSQRLVTGSQDNTVRIWDTKTGAQMFVLRGHTDLVHDVDYSPGGKYVGSGSWDKTVRIWSAENGNLVASLVGHQEKIWWLKFSADGLYIASASSDRTVMLWNIGEGTCSRTILGTNDVCSVSAGVSRVPYLAVWHDLETTLVDVETGYSVAWCPVQSERVAAHPNVAAHPTGRMWAIAVARHLYLYVLEGKM